MAVTLAARPARPRRWPAWLAWALAGLTVLTMVLAFWLGELVWSLGWEPRPSNAALGAVVLATVSAAASPRRPEATGCARRCSPSSGATTAGACYAKRKQTAEPVFGQLKEQQSARRFTRRGLATCEAEWRLLCGTHNLLKLWRHTRRPASVAITT
jgi:hypothetical protein